MRNSFNIEFILNSKIVLRSLWLNSTCVGAVELSGFMVIADCEKPCLGLKGVLTYY